ncbi:hypothetical protein AWB76_00086 [Caballeronia temeraria]|uniref:Uncharacterized protein n=1 Tax=Caballeronia temeraria TaxID=1777137 RepID=A0A157Z257_9BURK|nr:hypothetical protein AWB76_00086 [Caballeronia temeraria]
MRRVNPFASLNGLSLTVPNRAPTLAALLVLASADLVDAVKRETGSEVSEVLPDNEREHPATSQPVLPPQR